MLSTKLQDTLKMEEEKKYLSEKHAPTSKQKDKTNDENDYQRRRCGGSRGDGGS